MVFIETPVFTRDLPSVMDDDDYQALQVALLMRPTIGRAIPGTGGLRKARWTLRGKGKRGGCRIIYYWDEASETCYMLYTYRKSRQEDLSAQQLRQLRRFVREEFG